MCRTTGDAALALAEALEQAYRLALALNDSSAPDATAAQLLALLDQARAQSIEVLAHGQGRRLNLTNRSKMQ